MTPAKHIRTLESLRRAKTEFHNKLCASSADPDPLLLQKLRSENVFVMTEFFFLLRGFDLIAQPGKLESYIRSHNAQIADLMADPARRRLMGLEVPRLQRGIFSTIQIQKAKANLLSDTPGLDQADIQRLTILLFSPETGRRVIEAMDTAGFVRRIVTPYQSKIVQSLGTAEGFFAEYLDQVRAELTRIDQDKTGQNQTA